MFCPKCGKEIPDDAVYCKYCDKKIGGPKKSITPKLLITIIVLIILSTVSILYFVVFKEGDKEPVNTSQVTVSDDKVILNTNSGVLDITKVTAAVVNIFCPFDGENITLDSEGYGGSGTIFLEDGFIVTNSHVIPQNGEYLDTPEMGCFVTLPDPETGQTKEIYLADPIVIPDISKTYDIAFLEIYDAYVDEDGYSYGTFPSTFPIVDDSVCSDELLKLGEEITVLGYPLSSGGTLLTVTEGVVSSFTEDGFILTSAKIDEGNSGGLAIDKDGCTIGIPSAVSLGEYENLGVIISVDLFESFLDEIEALEE